MKTHDSPKIRVSVLMVLILCLCSVSAHGVNVYVLSSGNNDIDTTVRSTLEDLGHIVHIGVECSQLHGGWTLDGYDTILYLNNWNANSTMPDSGQTALQQFVNSGGGLVTAEWVNLKYSKDDIWSASIIASALPAKAVPTSSGWGAPYTNNESPITYTVVEPNFVLNENVPLSFTFEADSMGGPSWWSGGTETKLEPKVGASVFYDSDNLGIGVVGWDYSDGRVISFSTVIGISELSNSNYAQLLSNALTWSAHGVPGPICTEPIPGDVNDDCMLDFVDLAIIFSHWLECNLNPPEACWQ